MSEQNIENGMGDTPERRAFEIRRRADNIFRSLYQSLWQEGEEAAAKKDPAQEREATDAKTYIISRLKTRIGELVPEAADEINSTLDELGAKYGDDRNRFIEQAVEATIQFLAEHLTLTELETRLKNRPPEYTNEELSRTLSCGIEGDKVVLHIPLTFLKNSKEVISSIILGLQVLAKKIRTEEKYQNINEIVGSSELVRKNYRLFTKYGFTIDKDQQGKPSYEARISKEKLLEKFG